MAFFSSGQQKLILVSLIGGILALLVGSVILFQLKKSTEGIVD